MARFEHAELIRTAALVFRSSTGVFRSVPFRRSAGAAYVAVIPAEAVEPPSLGYTIEVERTDGVRAPAFASRAEPYWVQVMEDGTDARERALLHRLGGRRSVAAASGEYVRFGTVSGAGPVPCAPNQGDSCPAGTAKTPEVQDQYWRVEGSYTYRPLRTIAEFSLRAGVVRGQSLVPPSQTLGQVDFEKYKVGLNYGAPTVRFRLADAWHLEQEALASITEVGFSIGLGTALLIGDPYGTKLTVGFETIGLTGATYFGSRFYSRLDIAASERVVLAPSIEVTDMPHAEAYGVRLLADASVAAGGGFSIGARGGYQARKSTSGGAALGGYVALAF